MSITKNITKSNIYNLFRGIVVILLAIAILITTSNILTLKSEDGISQFKSFYKQPEGSIDLLFAGSSKTYCVISTGVIWENYGISSFDLGGAEAPTWSTYYHLKEALKYQRPKVVAVELSTAALRPTLEPPEFWVEDNAYGMKIGENRTGLLKANCSEWLYKRIRYPLATMHQRYSELTADDFIDKNDTVNYKGYDNRNTVYEFETPDVSSVTREGEISEKSNEYLYKIFDLCKSEGIDLWCFITPYNISEDDQAIYNYYERICAEEGIPFVNFNDQEHIKAMRFDYETDLADEFHLNISGSCKYSDYMAQMLKDEYNLPDHRGDAYYSSWDVDALTLRMERTDFALGSIEDDAEWIKALNQENYLTYVTFGEGAAKATLSDDVLSALVGLGIPLDQLVCGNAIILKNGSVLYSNVSAEIEATIDNKYDSILLKRVTSEDENRAYETSLNLNGQVYEFKDEGVEIYAYDMSNCVMAGNRQILCQ